MLGLSVLLLSFGHSSAMKLNSGGSLSSECWAQGAEMVQSMAQDLSKSMGYDAMFYKGCLDFVGTHGNLSMPVVAQVEEFGHACKAGLFVHNESALGEVDPSELEAECDRIVYNMDIQARMIGPQAMRTKEGFCAVLIDLVIPLDAEPECMRFLEDVTHVHYEYLGTKHHWPTISKEPHFDEAFMRICLEDAKLEKEKHGAHVPWGEGAEGCELKLERLVHLPLKAYKGLPDFLADLCPLIEKPLPNPDHEPPNPYLKTTRSMTAALFHRASKIVMDRHRGNTSGGNASLSKSIKQTKTKKPLNALDLHLGELDETVSAKGGRRRRRRRRRLNYKQSSCCSGQAKTYEVNFAAAKGIAVGYNTIMGEGYNRWNGKHCLWTVGKWEETCAGVGLSGGVEAGVSNGYFHSSGNIAGESKFVAVGGCFGVCFGGEFVMSTRRRQTELGKAVTSGFGMGVDISTGTCMAWKMWSEDYWQRNLKGKCPSSGGCFPGAAVVQTPRGPKEMRDLRVGDTVLAMDRGGRVINDEIYFFGHADAEALAPFVSLQLQSGWGKAQELQLTPDHFIWVCPRPEPCTWGETRARYAADVVPGSYVWTVADRRTPELAEVTSTALVPLKGLYNPYTLSGNILVNDVVASAHSSSLLDPLTPPSLEKYLPSIYQASFFLGRWLYLIAGPAAADLLGVNNPQPKGQAEPYAAYGVAALSVTILTSVVWAPLAVYGRKSKMGLRAVA